MGLKGCEIVLDNPWNTYYAGQTVNGQVNFTFDSPKKIRGAYHTFQIIIICMTFVGKTIQFQLGVFNKMYCGFYLCKGFASVKSISLGHTVDITLDINSRFTHLYF